MNHNLKSFTDQVHKMRLAQERYFELAVEARKNHIHTKEKKDALVIAKNLEKQVDTSIQEIIKMTAVPDLMPEKIQGEFVVKDIEDKPL